ncbi:MAG: hypothetical protein GXP29_06970 [Planctomycetes bacterium]|nr:hypothetical protein [Planctomycetota bacterium]
MYSYLRLIGAFFLILGAVGCTPVAVPDPGVPASGTTVVLDLDSNGVIDVGSVGFASDQRIFDISSSVPAEAPQRATISLDAADISVGTSSDVGSSGVVVVTLRLSADVTTNACEAGTPQTPFIANIQNNQIADIVPAEIDVNTDGLAALSGGRFGLCVTVSTTEPRRVEIARLTVRFPAPAPLSANSCADVLALPQVQSALTTLAAASIDFSLPPGASPGSIVDSYTLTESTTFDPDSVNVGQAQNGPITFSNQSAATVDRTGFGSTVTQFIVGDATSIGLCTLARTNDPLCDQTIARLEALTLDPETGDLVGQFLAVAVQRHRNLDRACGATGDFVFGTVNLASQSSVLARPRGKVAVTNTRTPDLMLLSPGGGTGIFSDVGSGDVIQFDTSTPFASRSIAFPEELSPAGTSALGYSGTGAVMAIITDSPDAAMSLDGSTLAVIRRTASTTDDYIGETVDFDLQATSVFVPTTNPNFADRVSILPADTNVLAAENRSIPTPIGQIPVYARVSPDGSSLVALFESGAPIGQAGELAIANIIQDNPNFILPVINLTTGAGGTVLARELVFSRDSSQVFLAGLGAVVAIQTAAPFAITRIDVSDGANDNPVALALSGDGSALAVAIDDENGSVNFAVVDTRTLQVINRALLPGIDKRGAVDIAHFATGGVAMVANVRDRVVAVQTQSPFAFSQPLSVADSPDRNTVGRMASSGSVIAVSNVDEPAIYLFELAPAPQ